MNFSDNRPFRLTYETMLYLLAFAAGLTARLAQLGSAPLGDGEAQAALQALSMARSSFETVSLDAAQPLYTALTALLFNIIVDSNALARMVPALTGTMLVFLPLMILQSYPQLQKTSRWVGVCAAFVLALDPGLVLLSRSAGSSMPGVFFTLVGLLGAIWVIWPSAATPKWAASVSGAAFGAALLSGSSLWSGLLILALTLLAAHYLKIQLPEKANIRLSEYLPAFITAALVTIAIPLIAIPAILGSPLDMSGLGGGVAEFVGHLITPSEVPALRLLAALAIYHPLAVVFGLAAVIRLLVLPLFAGERLEAQTEENEKSLASMLSLWTVAALLAALVFPGREVPDLVWVLIPLWGLAALQLASALESWLDAQPGQIVTAASIYSFLFFMFFLNLLNLNTLWPDLVARFQLPGALAQISVIVAGIGLMLIIVSALFWLYWSPRLMGSALSLSTALALSLGLVGATWSLTRLRPDSTVELWRASANRYAAPGQLSELFRSLSQAAVSETGHRPSSESGGGVRTVMEVVLIDPLSSSSALNWALRSFPIRKAAALNTDEAPSAVLTVGNSTGSSSVSEQTIGILNRQYRGQDLIWQSRPAQAGALPQDGFAWLIRREAAQSHEHLILWVRGDIFPGGENP